MKRDELESVYKAYYKDVYLYALSLCQNPHEAEEITSDTFYKALFSLDSQKYPVKYWLLRVCKNLFIDLYRKNKKYNAKGLEDGDLTLNDNIIDKIIQGEEKRKLYICILRLPINYREVIYMFYFMDYSIEEISRLIGKSYGSVKTLLCRARVKLKKLLKEGENEV